MTLAARIQGVTKQFRRQRVLLGEVEGDLSDGSVYATGSDTPRTLADRLGSTLSLEDFGAVGNGSADDTDAIQRAVETAAAQGLGAITAGRGASYAISTTINMPSNVSLVGQGGDTHHGGDWGSRANTSFVWTGASGGTMFSFETVSGERRRFGGGIERAFLNAGPGAAGYGIKINSHNGLRLRDLMLLNFTGYAIDMNVASGVNEASSSTQACRLETIAIRCQGAVAPNGNGVRLGGNNNISPAGNSSYNMLSHVDCVLDQGVGLHLANCDNNVLIQCRVQTNATYGLVLDGSDDNSCAYENWIFHYTGTSIAKGTATYTIPSQDNRMFLAQSNGTSAPLIESGASCTWTRARGVGNRHGFVGLAIGNSETIANDAQDNTSYGLVNYNNGAAHELLARDSSGSALYPWTRSVNAAGDQAIAGGNGTGHLYVTLQSGKTMIVTLPTSDPGVPGALWDNAGVVNVSQ